jgi:TRAP-type C4-dicarboxylate transport system permease small subunit
MQDQAEVGAQALSGEGAICGQVPQGLSLPERLSRTVARFEARAAGLIVLAIFIILMGNVVSRTLAKPLIWTDELAVNLMAWAAFIGASLGLANRQHIAVSLLPDMLSLQGRMMMAVAVDAALLLFFAVFAILLWQWFDPLTLWRAGSLQAFSAQSFNFIYEEPTVTLGIRKLWFWLILPVFCLTGGLHVLGSMAGHVHDIREGRS